MANFKAARNVIFGFLGIPIKEHYILITCFGNCAKIEYSYLQKNANRISAFIIALGCLEERNGGQKRAKIVVVMIVVRVV